MNVEQKKIEKMSNPYKIKGNDRVLIKDVSENNGKGTVTGFATSYNYMDHDGDVGLMGHLDKSMNERGPNSSGRAKIKHLLFHNWEKIISVPTILENRTETINGQKVSGQYFETELDFRQDGHLDTFLKYQDGIYDNHSYGFRYIQLDFIDNESDDWNKVIDTLINPEVAEAQGYLWLQKESMQFEYSTVMVGANELTPNLGVKGANKEEQLTNIWKRYNKITKALTKGRYTDETMHEFEYQSKQIQQMIHELINEKPSLKDTLESQKSTPTFNLMDAISNL